MDPKEASEETTELKRMLTQGNEGGDKGGGRDRGLETVAASGASHPPVDVRVVGAGRAG